MAIGVCLHVFSHLAENLGSVKRSVVVTLILVIALSSLTKEDKMCGLPGNPAHGFVSPRKSEYNVGEIVKFTCDSGYELVGNDNRTCQPTGSWSDTLPHCVNPSYLKNFYASTSLNCVLENNTLRLFDGDLETCLGPSDQDYFYVELKNQKTISKITIFVELLESHSDESIGDYKFYSDVRKRTYAKCNVKSKKGNSYNVSSNLDKTSKWITLEADFLKNARICEVILVTYEKVQNASCGNPQVPLHGIAKRINFQQVEYSCQQGFQLTGSATRTCGNKPPEWQKTAPSCDPLNSNKNSIDSYINGENDASDEDDDDDKNNKQCNNGDDSFKVGIGVGAGSMAGLFLLIAIIGGLCYFTKWRSSKKRIKNDKIGLVLLESTSGSVSPQPKILLNPLNPNPANDCDYHAYDVPYITQTNTAPHRRRECKSDADVDQLDPTYAEVNQHYEDSSLEVTPAEYDEPYADDDVKDVSDLYARVITSKKSNRNR